MTRPTNDVSNLLADGFQAEWTNYNTVEGRTVPEPEWVVSEDPDVGQSSRRLGGDKRTKPYIHIYDNDTFTIEYNDVGWNSKDYSATCRFEVIVADDVAYDHSGKQVRDDILVVLEKIQDANAATGSVFGSDWQTLGPPVIDRRSTEFASQWRAYVDFLLEAYGLI